MNGNNWDRKSINYGNNYMVNGNKWNGKSINYGNNCTTNENDMNELEKSITENWSCSGESYEYTTKRTSSGSEPT